MAQSQYSSNRFPCSDGSEVVAADELGEKAIGVCNLEASHTLSPQGSGSIPFQIRSCWAWWEGNQWSTAYCSEKRDYTVELSGPTGGAGAFVLSGPGGDIPVEIAISHPAAGGPRALAPSQQSALLPGAPDGAQTPVSFEVTVPESANLAAGVYSNWFDFYLYQCQGDWQDSDCRGAVSEGRAELRPPIPFQIRLLVEPQIRISGLQDMVIDASGGGTAEAQQTFCVYTSGGADFRLRGDSRNGSGEFLLEGTSAGDTVGYRVRVQGLQPPRRRVWLGEGEFSGNRWQGHSQRDCLGGGDENMQLTIRVPSGELRDPQDRSYTDTLTLTVEIE
ncbi:hypothetical protein [Microbulbifer litoralis]|uniref:hypothetical protein n=1 Tax=Microbulbifer litoralis TaxID=2933965 RepID=UPI0020291104|nr:hypothetical protein [Microbulbifer sp. GX H0434]